MRAAIYKRLSRRTDKNVPNLASQEADCAALVERNGWDLVAVFSDLGESAFDRDDPDDRPGYADLVDLVEDGAVDVVVAITQDRLWRDPIEHGLFMRLARRVGVQVALTTGTTVDPDNEESELSSGIFAVVDRYESARKRRRARNKARQLAEAGQVSGGGDRPFGFGFDRVTVRDDEAALIREAAQHVLTGGSLRSLAADWNGRGVPTTAGRCDTCGHRRPLAPACGCRHPECAGCPGTVVPNRWSTGPLKSMLMSARIAGIREHRGKNPVPAVWPAIISVEQHAGLRAVLDRPARPGQNARKYLLTGGIARCALCGAALVARPRDDGARRYICAKGPNYSGCGRVYILAEPTEEFVARRVISAVDALGGPEEARPQVDPGLLAALRGYEARLERLGEEYAVEGLYDKAEYLRLRGALERNVVKARDAVQVAVGRGAPITGARVADGAGRVWAQVLSPTEQWWQKADLAQRRRLVAQVVESVTLDRAVWGRNRFDPGRLSIAWTEQGAAGLALLLQAEAEAV